MTLTKLKVRMNQSRFNLKQITLLTICSILLALSTPVMAKKAKTPPPVKPKISAVIVDSETDPAITSITIFGSDFLTPEVDLGTWGPLSVDRLTSTNTEINATTNDDDPPLIPAGDYKLVVSQGSNGKQQDDYDLTIGAVGPIGPAGADSTVAGPPGASCTVADCPVEGVTTLMCGETQVEIPCVSEVEPLLTCPCWAGYTEEALYDELFAPTPVGAVVNAFCQSDGGLVSVGREWVTNDFPSEDGRAALTVVSATLHCDYVNDIEGVELTVDSYMSASELTACRAEALAVSARVGLCG